MQRKKDVNWAATNPTPTSFLETHSRRDCCWGKIFSKTGYGWALGLLMLIPIANLIMLLVLAFGDWPVLKELKAQPKAD